MAAKRVSKKTGTKGKGRLKKGYKYVKGGGIVKVTTKKSASKKTSRRRRK